MNNATLKSINPVEKKVLILGNFRQTLTVIRSLARAGYYVIAGKSAKKSFTDLSRYTTEVWKHPNIKDTPEDFLDSLNSFLTSREDVRFVFPIGDTQLSFFTRYFEKVPSSVAIVMAAPSVVSICQDKGETHKINTELEVPQPESQQVYNYPELIQGVKKLGCPCVIKPNNSLAPFFNEKAIIIQTEEDIEKRIPHWPEQHQSLVMQQYIQGPQHNGQFAAINGELYSYFEYKLLRRDRIDGTGYLVDGISVSPTPKIREYCKNLVKRLNYSGVGCAQFLIKEENDSINFLELNPRLGAACALAFNCGCDFPKMAIECAAHLQGLLPAIPRSSSSYPTGKRAVWFMGDIEGLFRSWREGKLNIKTTMQWLTGMVKSLIHADFHLTWQWKDPLPTGYIFIRFAINSVKEVVKGFLGRGRNTS